jgi:hypothetical protein
MHLTRSRWLKRGKKFCYMGHRLYLPMDHPCASVQSGDDILRQLEGMVFRDETAGKKKEKKQKKGQSAEATTENVVWKKKSVFFRLTYSKDNLLRHNLDVMHIEKNVMDKILGTILNIKGKKKNDLAAHTNLQEMGLRPKLHLYIGDDSKIYMAAAGHIMSNEEKTNFLKVIRNLRVPTNMYRTFLGVYALRNVRYQD